MSYNPTLALNAINPSLVGYTGGIGKAMQAIGTSIGDVGKAKLDLEKQKEDERIKNAQLNLLTNADTRAQDAVKQGIADKAEKKQDTFNENVNFVDLYRQNRGLVELPELSNERAQAGTLTPDVFIKAQLADKSRKIHSDYNDANGERTILYEDGTTAKASGTGGNPFIEKATVIDTQYVNGKPTRVMTDMFKGSQNEVALPGVTDTIYNQGNSAKLGLANTIAGQNHAASVNLEFQPKIADAKNTNEVVNTIATLASNGFTEELSPGQAAYYVKNTPEGSVPNIQTVKINGVEKYFTKPKNYFTRPSR